MSEHADRRKWTWREWTLFFVSIGGMSAVGLLWKVAALPMQLQAADQAQRRDIEELRLMIPKIEAHEKELAVLESSLTDMKEDVKYIRRHMPR